MRRRLTFSELEEASKRRRAVHRGQESTRRLSDDYDLIGMLGEEAFAWAFGLGARHLELLPGGDGRVDFTLPLYTTVDVKTYEKPYNLLREAGKPHAEILVLAGFDRERKSVRLIGWEYDRVMQACPTRDFGYGVTNHYKAASELRPMRELKGRLVNSGQVAS